MTTDHTAEERRPPPRSQPEKPAFADVSARLTDLDGHARALIRQQPIVAVLTAASVGYLVARLVSRALR